MLKASSLIFLGLKSGQFVDGDFGSSLVIDGIVTSLFKDPSGRLAGIFDCIRI